jgi:hypothetical protein
MMMISQREIIQKGYQALVDALGTVNTIRFIQHFSPGQGNYTEERHQWLDNLTPEEIFAQMEKASTSTTSKPLDEYSEVIE